MIYVIFFVLTSVVACGLFQITSLRLACLVPAVLLATFAALRGPEVASDFLAYQSWYVSRDFYNGFLERPGFFEAIYFLINDVFAKSGFPFRLFIWVIAFFAVFFKAEVIFSFARNSFAVGVALLIYMLTFYLLHDFTQVRAGFAVAMIYLAARSLVDGKPIRSALLLILAAGFHSSALLGFFLFLPSRGKAARLVDWVLVVATGGVILLAAFGVAAGMEFVNALSRFDPRLALYISIAEVAQVRSANPFAVSALLILALALSLMGMKISSEQILAAEALEEYEETDGEAGLVASGEGTLQANPDWHGKSIKFDEFSLRDDLEADNSDVDSDDFVADTELDDQETFAMLLARRGIMIGTLFLAALFPIPELALRVMEFSTALIPILAVILFSQRGWLIQKTLLLLWVSAIAYVYIFRNEGLVRPYVLFFS